MKEALQPGWGQNGRFRPFVSLPPPPYRRKLAPTSGTGYPIAACRCRARARQGCLRLFYRRKLAPTSGTSLRWPAHREHADKPHAGYAGGCAFENLIAVGLRTQPHPVVSVGGLLTTKPGLDVAPIHEETS
jgi:hypothetical protein